jgi:uncharacterized protein (DUF362 family)
MELHCTLKVEKKHPSKLKGMMKSYYHTVLGNKGERYAEARWEAIKKSPSLTFYAVLLDRATAGWVIIDTNRSTVVVFLIDERYRKKNLETIILDKLVAKHKLIAAELPKGDVYHYTILEAYGFRPTREFTLYGIPMVKMDLSTAIYLEKLKMVNKVSSRREEVVAIEKIPETQTDEEIKRGLEKVIKALGGLKKFLKKGDTVVLKPNIVSDHGIKNGVKKGGIVTDIKVVKAMVELLYPVAGRIVIADGSSINRSETMKMFTHYGYDELSALYTDKVSLVDLNSDKCVEKRIPGGRRLEKRMIPKTLLGADVIINMPVLKLHFAAGASLSIKNLQGAIPPLEKYKVHFFGLWQNLINTYKVIMPDLIIMDGLYGQEDFGPISGVPKKMDLLIGGTNPVAVDTVALKIMGLTVEDSPPVLMAYHEGLGPIAWDCIKVKGASLEEVSDPFKRPFINLESGRCFKIHDGDACSGCRGYLHFVLNKLRRPDPREEGQQLIDRTFERRVNVFLGPRAGDAINAEEDNIFMGICQQHHAGGSSIHLPGCPPHAEEIIKGIFSFYQDLERPKYADKTEEEKLGEILKSILNEQEK